MRSRKGESNDFPLFFDAGTLRTGISPWGWPTQCTAGATITGGNWGAWREIRSRPPDSARHSQSCPLPLWWEGSRPCSPSPRTERSVSMALSSDHRIPHSLIHPLPHSPTPSFTHPFPQVYASGYGAYGRLGIGGVDSVSTPTLLTSLATRGELMYGCMDVWVYGCVDVWVCGCMDGWMDVWMYGCMDVWMYGCMGVWMYGCVDVWMYGCMDVWMYGCVDVWMNGCMDVWVCGCMDEWMCG